MTNTDLLRAAPFGLDQAAIDWVIFTKAQMTLAEKIGQLFVFHSMGQNPDELALLAQLKPAGITRNFSPDIEFEARFLGCRERPASQSHHQPHHGTRGARYWDQLVFHSGD